MLLLLTNTHDLTIDLVVEELRRRDEPFLRLNCDRMVETGPVIHIRNGDVELSFKTKARTIVSSEIKAAYLRRPDLRQLVQDAADRGYCLGEWRALLAAVYSELSGRWLSEPDAMEAAENKVAQLRAATSLGFGVPRTVVSNDPEVVRDFAGRRPSVVKPLRNGLMYREGREHVVFTTQLANLADTDFSAVRLAPIIVQEEIAKAADIRVTVVGERAFAARIESQSDMCSKTDWRRGEVARMPHRVHDLPPEVSDRCVAIVRKLNLRFGAIDLVLDRDGSYWFLEINPNGQWGWIQARTGQLISVAIADVLTEIARS